MSTIACPICGRRITTSGAPQPPTSCPACGASLLAIDQTSGVAQDSRDARDDSDTRPVPLDQFSTRPVSPASVPPPAAAEGETRDLPASALSQPPASSGSGAPGAPGMGRRLARGLSVAALVAMLLAIVAVAALAVNGALPFTQQPHVAAATPTVTTASASATPAIPESIIYTRPGFYHIAYPTGWFTKERNNTPPGTYWALIYDPQTGASLNITFEQTSVYFDAATVDTNYLNGLAAPTGTKATNLTQPTAITLAGQTWTEEAADVAILNVRGTGYPDQYAHAVALTTNHNGAVYTIVRLVPVSAPASARSAFDAAERANFQPMLATFTFLR